MRRFSIAVALLLLASPLAAQSVGAMAPLTAHVEVEVVNVDVTVTDRDGNPVLDLTKDDFELIEDGVPQKITNFYVVEGSTLREEGAPRAIVARTETPPEFRRKILLVVDNNFMETAERNIALRKIEQYVSSSFDAEWAMAAIGQGADIVQTFTSDRAAIRAGFEKLRSLPTFYSKQEIDRSILSDRGKKTMDFRTDYDYEGTVRFASREQTFRSLFTVQNTTRAIGEMARAHSADVGKKYIILLTGGMESNTTFSAYEREGDQELRQLRLDIGKTVDGLVHVANSANFTVHVINARTRGMAAPQHDVSNGSSGLRMENILREGGGNQPIDTTDVDSTPLTIAEGTGGLYLPSNDIVGSVRRIEQQTGNFYSLGYSPGHHNDRAYHRINVKVKRPGLRVTNRAGYYGLSAEDRLEDMLRARPTFDRNVGILPVAIDFGTAKTVSGDSSYVLPVRAALPMDKVTVIPRDDGYVGRVHVYLSVFDEAGRNIGFHHQTQEVTLSESDLRGAAGQAFRYTMNVHLKKQGNFTVVMVLRDELSNEMGSAVEAVKL